MIGKNVIIFLLLLCMFSACFGVVTHHDLIDKYFRVVRKQYAEETYRTLLPRSFTNETVKVNVELNLASINDFDEVSGYLEISGYLTITWTETPVKQFIQYNTTLDANETVLVPITKMWTPPVLLMNSMKTTSPKGDASSIVRLNVQSGHCTWVPLVIVRGSCTPDVRYYPFDKQSCGFQFAAWGHTKDEIELLTPTADWSTGGYEENGEWAVLETSARAYARYNVSFVEFSVELERRPTFFVINLLAPIILLGLLNVFVFVLPADSGERIGYSVTCFLAYVVLMNVIMGQLPVTSAPMSFLCYYMFAMMFLSAGMLLATILSMVIYFKDESDTVPAIVRGILYCATCQCCFTTTPSNGPAFTSAVSSDWDDNEPGTRTNTGPAGTDHGGANTRDALTWKTVAKAVDLLFFVGFLAGNIVCSVSFLLPIILS